LKRQVKLIYKKKNINPKGIVVINPGNPTGNCLKKNDIKEIKDLINNDIYI